PSATVPSGTAAAGKVLTDNGISSVFGAKKREATPTTSESEDQGTAFAGSLAQPMPLATGSDDFRQRYGYRVTPPTPRPANPANVPESTPIALPSAPSAPPLGSSTVVTNSASPAWMDNTHSKQGNLGIVDGTIRQWSLARDRSGLQNSGGPGDSALLFPGENGTATKEKNLSQSRTEATPAEAI